VAVLAAFFLVAASCGGDEVSSPTNSPATPAAELECEAEGYPCSLQEVPDEILERSATLGDEALAMFDAGSSMADVDSWLAGQDGMAEVASDDLALRFRLDGGRGNWILRSGALGTRGSPGQHQTAAAPSAAASAFRSVVGGDSDSKRALVLSPFLWDFGSTDDGEPVAEILAGTRGYTGGVVQAANPEQTDTNVNIESFKRWGDFDVVHVVSHGFRLCSKTGCRAVISSGTLQGPPPGDAGAIVKKAFFPADRGVELGKSEGCGRGLEIDPNDDPDAPCPPEKAGIDIVLLSADFFRGEYGGGLQDTLVFFNACETFGAEGTDLATALRGSNSVFLGWDERVDSGAAFTAGVALYEELSEIGSEVKTAYDRLGSLQTDAAGAHLVLGESGGTDGLRIRDVVFLLDPESGNVLSAGDNVAIVGAVNDGEDDLAPYVVQVDGIPVAMAADAELHVMIDGVEAEPQTVSEGSPGSQEDQWTVSGRVELGYDLEEDNAVPFRAWVDLPDGGESDHETPATLTGAEPLMGYTWILEAEWSRTPTQPEGPSEPETATARLTLEFKDNQRLDAPKPEYVVTGGTVTWDPSYTDRICRVKGDSVTYDIGPISEPWVVLIFDTTVTPVTWSAFIETIGPDAPADFECLAGTGPDADPNYKDPIERMRPAEHIWVFVERAEGRTVTGDQITGSWVVENPTQPSYKREARFTITRVK
jgi:hypothetical protein